MKRRMLAVLMSLSMVAALVVPAAGADFTSDMGTDATLFVDGEDTDPTVEEDPSAVKGTVSEEIVPDQDLFTATDLTENATDLALEEKLTVPSNTKAMYHLLLDEPGFYIIEGNELLSKANASLYKNSVQEDILFPEISDYPCWNKQVILNLEDVSSPWYLYLDTTNMESIPVTVRKLPVQNMVKDTEYPVTLGEGALYKFVADETYTYSINSWASWYRGLQDSSGHLIKFDHKNVQGSYPSFYLEKGQTGYVWIEKDDIYQNGSIQVPDKQNDQFHNLLDKFHSADLPQIYDANDADPSNAVELTVEPELLGGGSYYDSVYAKFVPKHSGTYAFFAKEREHSLNFQLFDSKYQEIRNTPYFKEGDTYYLKLTSTYADSVEQLPIKHTVYAGWMENIKLSLEGTVSRDPLYRKVDVDFFESGGGTVPPGLDILITYSWGATELARVKGTIMGSSFLYTRTDYFVHWYCEKTDTEGVYNVKAALRGGRPDLYPTYVTLDVGQMKLLEPSELPLLQDEGTIEAVVNSKGQGWFRFKTGKKAEYTFSNPYQEDPERWPYSTVSVYTWNRETDEMDTVWSVSGDYESNTFALEPGTEYYVVIGNPRVNGRIPEDILTEMQITVTTGGSVPSVTPSPSVEPSPSVSPEATETPSPEETPSVTPSVSPEVSPSVTPSVTPETTPSVTPEATPSVSPEATPSVTPEVTPTTAPEPTTTPSPEITPGPVTSEDVSATPALGTKKVTLSWKAVPEADGYLIYLKNEETGEFKRIKTIYGSDVTSFTKKVEDYGGTYTFKIQTFKKAENGPSIYEDLGEEITVRLYGFNRNEKPDVKASVPAGSTSAHLSWEKIDGAAGYMVYKYNPGTKKYTLLDQISGGDNTSYDVKSGLENGVTYAFRVRGYAVKEDGTTQVKGKTCKTVKVTVPPAKVKKPAAVSKTKSEVQISWPKVDKAKGYLVYRSTSKNGEYTQVATVSGGKKVSYTDKNLQSGKVYYYKVCAYSVGSGKTKCPGEMSPVKKVKVK